MHWNHPFHKRFFARAAAAPLVPSGYTLSEVTVVETVKNLRTTVLRTDVATVIVPIKSTPVPATPTPKPVVSTPPPAVTPSAVVTPSPASSPASPSVVSPSVAASSPASVLTPSSPIVSPSPATSPSASRLSSPASVASASHASKTAASAAASHSASAGSDVSTASSTSKGLSGGAIGGIVAGFLILALAVLVFAVRRSFLRRRKQKRDTWGAGLYPKPEPELFEQRAPSPALTGAIPPPTPEKPTMQQRYNPVPVAPFHQPNVRSSSALSYQQPLPPPPPATYNSVQMSPVLAPVAPTLQPSMVAPAVQLSHTPAMTAPASQYAHVRCTFIPSLPDELSISTGELVRILGEFDDGWALCANQRGEQGVVPLECLDRQPGAGMGPVQVQRTQQIPQAGMGPGGYPGQGTGDWRMSRRASSLYAAVAAHMQAPGVGMHY